MRKKFIIYNIIIIILQLTYIYLSLKVFNIIKQYLKILNDFSNSNDPNMLQSFLFLAESLSFSMDNSKIINCFLIISIILSPTLIILCIIQLKRCFYYFKQGLNKIDIIKIILLIIFLYIPCFIFNIKILIVI